MVARDPVDARDDARGRPGAAAVEDTYCDQPHALGVGYDFLGTVLRGEDQLVLKAVLALMLAKILASAFSYGSGMSGGVLGLDDSCA